MSRSRSGLAAIALVALFSGSINQAEEAKPKDFAFEEFLIAPVRVHLMSAKGVPDWETTLSEKDLARVLTKANRVWSQAGVYFYIESLVREEAVNQDLSSELKSQTDLRWLLRLCPDSSKSERQFHLYYIKRMPVNGIYFREAIFVKDTASLRNVEGGIDEPLPRVSSHELGHALSLPHRQATTNLMASGTTGTRLNQQEVEQARKAAQRFEWIQTAPDILKRANELYEAEKRTEARTLYQALGGLPVKSEAVERAKNRAAE